MLNKMVITKCSRVTKGTRPMLCLEYTLKHNQKKKQHYILQIHVHLELAQTSRAVVDLREIFAIY